MTRQLHAMFVHAHPDDESSKGAGTMAKYVKEGYRVSVVTLTDGGAGDILNPAMDRPGVKERMVEIRREEIAAALTLLGVTEHHALDYPDSGWVDDFDGDGSKLAPDAFYNVPMDAVLARLVPIIRETRPHVLVTYDERGGYPHPDHVRCHQVSIAAARAAAEPDLFPEAGPTWRPAKIYYHETFNLPRIEALHHALLERGMESDYGEWLERWDRSRPHRITTRVDVSDHLEQRTAALKAVDVSDHLEQRTAALKAHATQIDPESRWFALPDDVMREVYPWEDYRLAFSEVATDRPERSLFEGLE